MEVRILPSPKVVLAPIVIGFFVNHETAAFHPDGVAAAEEVHQVWTVIAALNMAPREVLVLIEDNLDIEIIMVLLRNRHVLFFSYHLAQPIAHRIIQHSFLHN